MAYDPGAIDSALAAAVGDDPELAAELRGAFVEGAIDAVRAMREAADDGVWSAAALRLRGLAASFGAIRLMALAGNAGEGARDAAVLGRIERAVARL